eukprot:TRINITY_DN4271_c3_g2_i1.p1 TRINITY_DN4271_c3_g2~~TRINITY_DN4271_c3_g2_i1.p1  ORF type:complete len:227 (+),score=85.12 TRINITY_DN4271_c3_g2_i1:98-778(+)
MLEKLTGTKSSISSARDWILEKKDYGTNIAVNVLNRMELLQNPDQKIHVVYLLNDVLFHCTKLRTSDGQLDNLSACILDKIIPILQSSFNSSDMDKQEKIIKILQLWKKRNIFEGHIVEQIELALRNNTNPPISLVSPYQMQQQPPIPPQFQQPPMQQPWMQQPPQQQQQQQQPWNNDPYTYNNNQYQQNNYDNNNPHSYNSNSRKREREYDDDLDPRERTRRKLN